MKTISKDLANFLDRYDASVKDIEPTGKENVDHIRHCIKFAEQEAQMDRSESMLNMDNWASIPKGVALKQGEPIVCGSTFCLAGWSAYDTMTDGQAMTANGWVVPIENVTAAAEACPCGCSYAENFGGMHASDIARKNMGINRVQSLMFQLPNNIELIKEFASVVCGEEL